MIGQAYAGDLGALIFAIGRGRALDYCVAKARNAV
jgi:hypothetical protein